MIYLALAALVIGLCIWLYRRSPGVQRGRWRVGTGLLASALLGGGALVAARGLFVEGALMVVVALVMAGMTRSARGARAPAKPSQGRMTADEARSILGVNAAAGPDEVRSAYTRLMRMAHPDKGGTTGLAAQLNAARDHLLK